MRARLGSLAALAAAIGLGAWVAIPASGGHGRDPRAGHGGDPPGHSARGGDPPGRRTGPAPPAKTMLPALGAPPSQSGALGPTETVSVSGRAIGHPMRPGFLGLSLEYYTLPTYLGQHPAHLDPVFLALLRGLAPGQAPVLRIGGNSTDHTWWPSRGMRAPRGASFALSRHWTALARALASRTGTRLILGVNLAGGNRRAAAVEARRLVAGIGARHVAALEVGNEPDDYPVLVWYRRGGRAVYARPASWTAADYLRQFRSWAAALPHLELAGPALARLQWMPAVLPALVRGKRRVGLITFHRYPLRACETHPRAGDYPTIPRLLSDASSAGLAARVAPVATSAHAAGRQFRLDELNSVSCQGRLGVSNTFASALWALDTLFDLKAAGVDGVNVHMLPGSAYQAFSVRHARGHWSARVAPLYYGMLLFTRAFPPGARLLHLTEPSGELKAWATRSRSGQLRVVLINKNPTTPVNVRLRLPGPPTPLSLARLRAPSVGATSGVSLGGKSFGSSSRTGVLRVNRHLAQVSSLGGSYSLSVPGGSAVLLTR